MSAAPYMQFYVGDYIQKTLHLTTEQHGAYLLLLMALWNGDAALPNDPAKLARITRVSPKRWPIIWAEISSFFTVADGYISQDRLTKERQKVLSISQERKQSGSLGGKAKALKSRDQHVASANILPDVCFSIPEPEPDIRKREGKPSLALVPKAARFDEFWAAYPHRGGAKRGRKPAEAKYLAAVKAGASEQDIIDGAKRAAMDRQVRAGFARDPTTWLNQDGWNDEIDTSRETQNGNGNYNIGNQTGQGRDRFLDEIAIAARARPSPGGIGH